MNPRVHFIVHHLYTPGLYTVNKLIHLPIRNVQSKPDRKRVEKGHSPPSNTVAKEMLHGCTVLLFRVGMVNVQPLTLLSHVLYTSVWKSFC